MDVNVPLDDNNIICRKCFEQSQEKKKGKIMLFSERLLIEQRFNEWRSEVMNETGTYPAESPMNVAGWLISTEEGKKWLTRMYKSVHGSDLKCDRCDYKAVEGLKSMMHCPKCQYGRLRDIP